MNQTVLYVSTSSQALPTGGGRTRIVSMAKQAKKHGFDVVLLCFVRPDQISPISQLVDGLKRLVQESGARVYYIPRVPWAGRRVIRRLNLWYCSFVTALMSLRHRVTIAHAHGISAACYALAARRIKRGLKVIADVHGASLDEYLYGRDTSRPDKMAEYIQRQEEYVFKEADWLIFVSDAMRKHFEYLYRTRFKRCSVIPCAVDTDFEVPFYHREGLRRHYGIENKIVFCYVGSGEDYQLPAVMCRLFHNLLEVFPEAFFLILSHHGNVFANHLKAENISDRYYLIKAVEHDKVLQLLLIGDIGFLLRDESIVNRVASPTKFAEYCLAGLPVITTDFVGDFSAIIKEHDLGWIVDLHNIDRLDQGLISFIRNVQANRKLWALRCSRFAQEHLSWQSYGYTLASIYADLNKELERYYTLTDFGSDE